MTEHDYEFIFAERRDAVNVLHYACNYIQDHNAITIRRLYKVAHCLKTMPPKEDETYAYGWTDLSKAYIETLKCGYELVLPKPRKFRRVKAIVHK